MQDGLGKGRVGMVVIVLRIVLGIVVIDLVDKLLGTNVGEMTVVVGVPLIKVEMLISETVVVDLMNVESAELVETIEEGSETAAEALEEVSSVKVLVSLNSSVIALSSMSLTLVTKVSSGSALITVTGVPDDNMTVVNSVKTVVDKSVTLEVN